MTEAATALAQFADWWERLRLPIRYFRPHEMFAKGDEHPELWTPPPQSLWLNIVPTVLIAQVIRHEFGYPLKVTSAYRNPDHNRAVGGVRHSEHLAFRALDLVPIGGQAHELFYTAIELLGSGPLAWDGGLGRYSWGIHIDTRLTGRATWSR